MPPSATRLMPASCIGRKRSGMRIESDLPTTSSSVWPNITLGAAVPGDDVAVLVGGDDRVGGGLGDRAEAVLGLAQGVAELLAGDLAAELAADVRGDLEQAVVRRDGLQREALDDGVGLVADRDREGEGAAQAALGAGLGAREVRVAGDVDDPGGAAGGGDAARQADARGQRRALRVGAEGLELRRVPQVPDARRLQRVVLVLAGDVDVTDGPAGPAADVLDAGLHRLGGGLRLGGGGGDGLDQRNERRVGRE